MTNAATQTVESSGGQPEVVRIPLIGEPAPAFQAVTTQGPIRFPEDFQGK